MVKKQWVNGYQCVDYLVRLILLSILTTWIYTFKYWCKLRCSLFAWLLQLIGIEKMNCMFFVVMQVEVRNVRLVMYVGKIEELSEFYIWCFLKSILFFLVLILDILGNFIILSCSHNLLSNIVLIVMVGLCFLVFD